MVTTKKTAIDYMQKEIKKEFKHFSHLKFSFILACKESD